jgi:phosphatidylserine decarboxylase
MVPLHSKIRKSYGMQPNDPITFKNRHTGRIETEQVYGEAWLQRIYGNPLGKVALHALVKRSIFSQIYGLAMDRPSSAQRIAPFIKTYQLDSSEFADENISSYKSFNDFFYRKLKKYYINIYKKNDWAILPADGRHLGFQDISKINGVFAKGQTFDINNFLGDQALAERYKNGVLVCSRLCPVDYHRFHFPVSGIPTEPTLINGSLFSVNPYALRREVSYLWQNKRQRVSVDAGPFGLVTIVAIGATNVGTIVETYSPNSPVIKGQEKGYFRFGGSYIATLFEPNRIRLEDDLIAAGETQQELYAKMGSRLGRLI